MFWSSWTRPTPTSPRVSRSTSPPFAPKYLSREDVPAEVVDSERRVAEETTRAEGKPEAALPKIVEGRVSGFFERPRCSVSRAPSTTRSPSRRSSRRPVSP
ncbi:hypothetical protein [Streptomyces sp. KL116D]|uniref:hypothetical protein n=1 Tax=Streptomyces sp. KL116D TaxID=3045152 RepID=UPI0035590DC3